MESIGLYIHIPFCRQKCLYCDFPSWAGREGQMQMYVDALTAEIRAQGKRYENREVVWRRNANSTGNSYAGTADAGD